MTRAGEPSEPGLMEVETADAGGTAALLRLQNMMALITQLRLPVVYKVEIRTRLRM